MIKLITKRIISVILFGAILLASLIWVSDFFDKTAVEYKYGTFFTEENNVDVILMGTSRMYDTIMPQEMWNSWGIPSYNFAQSNCTIPISYYVLQMLDDFTDPSLVVIDLFSVFEYANIGNGKYRTDARDQQRVQFDAFPLSVTKVKAVYDVFDDYDDRLDFIFNLFINHNRWTAVDQWNFENDISPQKGAAFVLGLKECGDYTENLEGTVSELPPIGKDYLEKTVAYCEEKGIKILFTFLPFVAEQVSIDAAVSFDAYFSEEYLAEHPNVEYLNMLDSGLVNYRTDVYTDGSHLNYIGAAIVTEWLGKYIAENYPETVHRDDPAYASWDKDFQEYVDYKITRFKTENLYDNLQLVYGNDFTAELVVRSDSTELFGADVSAQDLIERLGDIVTVSTTDDESAAYVTIKISDCRNGNVVFETSIQKPE